MLMTMMMEVNSLQLRHLEQRQLGVGDERHVPRVDPVTQ